MRLTRYMREECVRLRLETQPPSEETMRDAREAGEQMVRSVLRKTKEAVVRELAGLLNQSERISNVSKLTTDLLNREKKATTGIGGGLAIPHVRTIQAREFLIAVGLSPEGLPFASLDDQPVRVFIAMVAPPYEDRTYLQVYPRIGQLFREDWMIESLLDCDSPGEVIRLLADC